MGDITLQIQTVPWQKVIQDQPPEKGLKLRLDALDLGVFREKFQVPYTYKPEFRFQVSLQDVPNASRKKEPAVKDSVGERFFQQYHETYPCEQYLGCAQIVTLFRFPFGE